jgi:putative nucleotidyltransferase with HDIG domain
VIGFSDLVRDVLRRVRSALPAEAAVYLVGGSVRDAMLGLPMHDLDFVLAGDVLAIARRTANALGAAYYPLDEERQAARLILTQPGGDRLKLDFTALRGPDLESDLRQRDFTINAMALLLEDSPSLVDPLGGAADLRAKVLRACSDSSLSDDPVRVVRGIRLATSLGCKIRPETSRQIRQAANHLPSVSPERLRDELFRMLEGPQPAASIRLLDMMGALAPILPEVVDLKGVTQSPPHITDVWRHTLEVIQRLSQVFEVLSLNYDQEKAANWALGFISIQLGRYRAQLAVYLDQALNPERSLRGLIFLAGLYHDVGKPSTWKVDSTGRIRFFEHEEVGAALAAERARQLRLSNDEVDRLSTIVRYHLRPLLLAQSSEAPSRRAIYRYFRAAGPAGIDIGLLSLADCLATYGPTLPGETWTQQLAVVRALSEAWWEYPEQAVAPPQLLNGRDLMQAFALEPGPQIGQLLEAIREAQAAGQVSTREQALKLTREKIENGEKRQES